LLCESEPQGGASIVQAAESAQVMQPTRLEVRA
jgi:hypothetical protein